MSRKVAIVTGSSRGIGRGIVLALAEHGWDVTINYRGNRSAAEETQAMVKVHDRGSIIIQGDIANSDDREKLVQTTLQEFGRIDLLVNNAGMGPRKRVDMLQVSESSYDEVMSTNLKGPFFLTQKIANEMEIKKVESGEKKHLDRTITERLMKAKENVNKGELLIDFEEEANSKKLFVYTIWIALIIIIVALAIIAFFIWRKMKKPLPSEKDELEKRKKSFSERYETFKKLEKV